MLNAMTMTYNDTKYTIYNIQCNDTKYTGDWRPPHLLPLLAPPQAGQVLTRYTLYSVKILSTYVRNSGSGILTWFGIVPI